MEKRENEFFMLSLGSRYHLAMQGKLPRRATTVSIRGLVLRYRARKKGHCIGRKLWSIVRSSDQERGPTFRVIGEAQILSFARLYYY